MGRIISREEALARGAKSSQAEPKAVAQAPAEAPEEKSWWDTAKDVGAGILQTGKRAAIDAHTLGPRLMQNVADGNVKELVKTGLSGVQGLTFGGADEAVGGLEALGEELGATVRGQGQSQAREIPVDGQLEPMPEAPSFGDRLKRRYREKQGDWQRIFNESTADNPAAQVAGGLIVPGGPTSLGGRVAFGAGAGALGGVLSNDKTNLLDNPAQALKEAAPSAVLGAAVPLVGAGLGKGAQLLKKPVQSSADAATLVGAGAKKADFQRMAKAGPGRAGELAQGMRDEGVVGALKTKADTNIASQAGMDLDVGPQIGDYAKKAGSAPLGPVRDRFRKALEALTPYERAGQEREMATILKSLEEGVTPPTGTKSPGTPIDDVIDSAELKRRLFEPTPAIKASKVAAEEGTRAGRPSAMSKTAVEAPTDPIATPPVGEEVPVELLHRTKSALQKRVFKDSAKELSPVNEARNEAQKALNAEVDAAIERGADPEALAAFQRLKKRYGILAEAEKLSSGAAADEAAQAGKLGLKELMAMGVGGLPAGLAVKLLDGRTAAATGAALNAGAGALDVLGKGLDASDGAMALALDRAAKRRKKR